MRHRILKSFVEDHNVKYPKDRIIYTNDRQIPLKKQKIENKENWKYYQK